MNELLPQTPLPQTPLQQALQTPQAAELWLAHRQRLAQLRRACRQQLDAGLPPADFAQAQLRLRMCEAAERVLQRLQPAAAGELRPSPLVTPV